MNNKQAVMAIVGVAALASLIAFTPLSETGATPTTKDSSLAVGHVKAWVVDSDGNIKAYRQTDNVIVNTGLDIIANQVFGNGTVTNGTAAGPTYASSGGTVKAIGLGTGGGGIAQAGQDDLTTIVGGACANLTVGSGTGGADWTESTDQNNDATFVHIISNTTFQGSSCAGDIDEVGLFTALTGTQDGRLFAAQEFSPVTVTSSDSLTINWDIKFSDN